MILCSSCDDFPLKFKKKNRWASSLPVLTLLRIRWTIPFKFAKFHVFSKTEFRRSWDKNKFCDIFAKIWTKIIFVPYFCPDVDENTCFFFQ